MEELVLIPKLLHKSESNTLKKENVIKCNVVRVEHKKLLHDNQF